MIKVTDLDYSAPPIADPTPPLAVVGDVDPSERRRQADLTRRFAHKRGISDARRTWFAARQQREEGEGR